MANNNIFSGNNTFGNFMNNTWFIAKATPTSSIISDAAKKSINDYVDSLGLQGMDKQLKIQELTQKTMEAKKQNEYNQWRADVKTDIWWKVLNATNKEEAQSYKSQGKLADLADMVRWYIQKSSWKVIQWDDQEVVSTFLKDNQAMVAPFASYMGWEMSAYEFAQLYWFDASPEEIATEKRNSSWRSSLTSDEWEWNDDILWHFETESYDDAGEWFWDKAGTFGMNFLKSTYNLGSDVVNLVANPIDTVNNLSKTLVGWIMNLTTLDDYLDPNWEWWLNSANQVADWLGDILKERYWSWEWIKNTAYTDPMGMVSDIASIIEWWAWLVKWVSKWAAVWTAKLWMKNIARNLDDVSKVAGDVTKVAHYSDPFNLMMEWWGKGISYVGNKAINSKRANGIKDSALNLEDSIVWLDKETKKAIQSNPYAWSTWKEVENYIDENGLPTRSQEVSKSLIADLSTSVQEDLKKYIKQFNETWPLYKSLKNGNYSVDLSWIKEKINNFLEEQWVKIWENGSLDFTDTAVTPTEASAIRRAYQWLTPDEAQPVSQYLRHRRGIDQLWLWEDAKWTPWKDILKGMREFANEEAHNQIKPLKELDKLYSEQIDLLNKATEWLVYRDKRRFWEYRDNFNQILKNMDTPNRKRLKDRLEKIIPWLEQKVEAINLMPKLIDNYYRPWKADKWLSYAWWMAGSVAGWWLPWLAIGAGVWYWLSKLYDKVKSSRWEKAISSLSEEWKNKMAEIEKAIAENKALSKEQTATLRQIWEELKANKKIKEWQIAELMWKLSEVENIDQLDGLIAEFKKIWANDAVKELEQIKEWALKNMAEQQEMDRYAKEFEAEKQNIINESADQRLPEFKRRIYQLWQEERRIWSVAWKKIWKSFEWKDYKNTQQTEWLRKKDKLIEEIWEYYNVDQFEAAEIYDRIERTASADDLGFSGKPASSKTAKYQVADQTQTPEFKKWFAGSKVVNEDWTPKIMYHWTPKKWITKFDAKHRWENTGNYWYAWDWFYFTDNPNYAKSYWDNVMAVYLDVKKPFKFTKENIKKYAKYFDWVEQWHIALDKEWVLSELKKNDKLSYEFAKDWLRNKDDAWSRMSYPYKTKYDPNTIVDLLKETEWDWRPYEFESKYLDEFEWFWKPKYVDDLYSYPSNPDYMLWMWEYSNQEFIDAIRKDWFDGIESLWETVVFEPNQIKSATDNIWTFDKNNPDIRFQKYWTAWRNEKWMAATEWLNIRNFKNWKTVKELANQYWIDTKIVDSISTPEWQRAYWMYWDRLITLSKDLKESTVPHELLHGVFDIVDSKRRTSILEWIQKKLNIDNVQAEEWLADNFSEYYRTGKFWTKWLAKWLVEKVKQFFYEVKSYIDWTYKNEKQIRQLFDDIIDWKIEWEYGVYSDPKFQSVWHGSPADFERFDSTHMWEWEWAQAHGWGHYVAAEEWTARHYAEMQSEYGDNLKYKGKEINYEWEEWEVANMLAEQLDFDNLSEIETVKDNVRENLRADREEALSEWDKARVKELDKMIKMVDDFNVEWGKNLYEVEIPDPIKKDTPTWSNYLEEDGKLSEKEWNELADLANKWGKENWGDKYFTIDGYWGQRSKDRITNGKLFYDKLTDYLHSQEKASKFLESIWYDWIHYLWGRDWEAYVIFNDDALQITKHHKY